MNLYDEELTRLSALAREAWPGRARKVVRGDYRDGLPTYEVLGFDDDGSPAMFLYVEAHSLGILAMGAALRVLAHGLPAREDEHAAAQARVRRESGSIEDLIARSSLGEAVLRMQADPEGELARVDAELTDEVMDAVRAANAPPTGLVALARGWLSEARQYRELADGGGDNLWQRERYAHAAGVLERCAEELFARFAAERNER